MLPEKVDRYLVDLYRRWDHLERKHYENSIIDFDLAPPRRNPLRINDRVDVLERLESAAAELEGDTDPAVELAHARLKASAIYLRALSGESIAFQPYIRQTLGVEPKAFSAERVQMQRDLVADHLWERYRMRFTKDERSRFQGRFMEYDTNKLPERFEHFRSKWLPELIRHIPVSLEKYKVTVKFASEDAYWKNWISGNLSKHKILLRINIHPRQVWYEGFSETLVIHEYCGHAIQMISWHGLVEHRILPEFFGILTVHFPDQFLLEGLAESLVFVLPGEKKLREESYVSRELHRYSLLIMNNVHIMANEQSAQKALDYALASLPFTPRESIVKEIRDRTQDPLFRCYQYVYGIANEAFLASFSRLRGEHGWELLRLVYDCPMTAAQFEKEARKLAIKPLASVQS